MKYSYSVVFIVLVCHQVLSILAADDQKEQNRTLLRNKRQASYRPGLGSLFKRDEYNRNYNMAEELDEPELSSSNGNNQKREKSKTFVAWGGRKRSANAKQNAQQRANINGYLAATNGLNTIKREKPGFRSWGGKRSVMEPPKLNDYLKRLEALDMLLNELDLQNYD